VVNRTVAGRLGLVPNLGVLINAPADNLNSLVQKVQQLTGSSSHVISLQPTTASTQTKLPVDTTLPTTRPTTYLQLYKASAARYCPRMSLSALAAMGEFGTVSVVSSMIAVLTNTMPLQVEILYNEYAFTAAFAVASLLALLALNIVLWRTYAESLWEKLFTR